MSDKNFPVGGSDSSKPILVGPESTTYKGDTGDPAYFMLADPPFIGVPSDNDGSNPVFANAEGQFVVQRSGTILADDNDADGWVLTLITANNCTVTLQSNEMDFAVTAMTADAASFQVKASKASYPDLYAWVFVRKIKEGATGAAGAAGAVGAQGPQGIQGPAGEPATGNVTLKFPVTVKDPYSGTVNTSNNGSSKTRLTFSIDPDVDEGHVFYMGSPYDAFVTVTSVIGAGVYDTDEAYQADEAIDVWDARNLKKGASGIFSYSDQYLFFPGIIPQGAKLDEIALVKTGGSNNSVFFDLGYELYPASGYSRYMASKIMYSLGTIEQVNLWDPTRYGYSPKFIKTGSPYQDLYARVRPASSTQLWDSVLDDQEYEIFISYKFFDTSL